ncbi:LysM peptidoglycan-binding domain-containing protein [Pseudodonghicola flavimaris]|uniref:LysM peptidoglycan-binding domain-containing protein n=1 Tax=Pseudodonghicola flavimaris TaxID=3050036 RepID=A0ABT7EV58_9RHOB|nr:LysM peptidoglycan-binding domain-containing protein [Pseudodonghicola flavimaris]MDK3016228.1 LysM peptidoglycan-binding domain-containing protein [Pseudodonghicola flavimaris]
MSFFSPSCAGMTPRRLLPATALLALLAGCSDPMDFDLRGNLGGFSTAEAARAAGTAHRPEPDARGIISYPSYQVAVSRRGDTVASVASRIGVPAGDLARFNGMQPQDALRPGEVLALPGRVSEPPAGSPGSIDIATLAGSAIDAAPDTTPQQVQTAALEPAQNSAGTPAASAPPARVEPIRHKVVRGETAYTISRLYQVPVKALAEWNGLGADFAIREGQYLLIPVKDQPAPRRAAPQTSVTPPGVGSPTPTPPSAVEPLPDEKISATPPEPPKVSVGSPSKASAAAMGMPITGGKIIRAYSKGRNDGIDISGTAGTAVKAAREGTVAAITQDADQVPIIVVRHDANLLTVYANVTEIAVNKGDRVKRGQTLAQLRSGSDAYLHFEVRDGFESVDPAPYLK